ncbi:phosphate ABC transporter substrate-binding protein PstS family protein [Scytonema sp. UIC 10036]|uniref:PstS family phosphate ABC transporter substrate-binding protein n=1 Tax=Scytonema sp. UIC 10036 TaxID=2304196 RepID=UPI0012DAC3BC|nr:PstS family phosphate ABC transporter substrate-binding protein [Scytonema sp. UIC 10036]MUG99370.1 phosphate ABC transporter substrate-binding protein PstS family protein [Scytonema sp. UIC 10036]
MKKLVKLAFAIGALAITTHYSIPVSYSQTTSQKISVDGSSTVYPITQAIAKEYQSTQNSKAQVTVNVSGTSGGFEQFCAGKTDISNASRPIAKEEMETCKKNNVRYIELPIAFDALSIVVNPQNNWAKDITLAELKKIWEPAAQGKITRWNQVRASWPNRPLKLYGPGNKSGTFDYFTEAVVGKSKASRSDYTASEDDEVLAQGISKDADALGYFGYAYLEEHKDKLKAIAVDSGSGPVLPSRETVEKAKYQPLSRPLFIYVNPWAGENKQAVYQFVDFYLKKAPVVSASVGYVPLPEEAYRIDYVHFHKGKVGTVFGGKSQLNLTIGELLRQRKEF